MKRFNIGIAVAAIKDPFSYQLSRGAMSAAEKFDVNLYIFPGKYIGVDYSAYYDECRYEYQYNALFDIAAAAKLDYMISAVGSIAYPLDNEGKKRHLDSFGGIPVLSVAANIYGYDYLMFDNRTGITQAVDHLVKEQGKRRIGMLYGDLNNCECAERFEAYRSALKKNGLPFDPALCMASDISENIYKEASLLVDGNPGIDAVLCVNDKMAETVYKVLNDRGIHIGREVAVVGFDDLPFASKLEPPLASVKADAYKLGERAVEKAVNFLRGVPDNNSFLPTEFIPRQSSYGQAGLYNSPDAVFSGTPSETAGKVCDYLYESGALSLERKTVYDFVKSFFEEMFRRFGSKRADTEDYNEVADMVDVFFNKEFIIVDHVNVLHELIDSGYRYLMRKCFSENEPYIRRLYNFFYKRINLDIASDYHILEEKHKLAVHYDNIVLRDALMIGDNLSESYSKMLKTLHLIGADSSYSYIFSEPVEYHMGERFPANKLSFYFAGYAYGRDVFSIPEDNRRMSAKDIFADKLFNGSKRHTLIAADLFCKEYQYGMVLCEPRSVDFFDELELLTYQLSSVVKMVHLLESREQTLIELHSKNLALEDMSRIDELTNVYNRRGFYSAASELVRANGIGRSYIVCYADMDNLKMVNDRFGHMEGDFSIRSLADCLREIFGEKAVIGRMGGDEFAVLLSSSESSGCDDILRRKEESIERLNANSGKPYLINMSVGLAECCVSNSYDLKEGMDKADGKLYDAKAKRKKVINIRAAV